MLGLKTHENYPHPIKVSSCLQVRAILRHVGHGGNGRAKNGIQKWAGVERSALKDARARKDSQ